MAFRRSHLFDWNRRGAPDLIIGNYGGDILLVPNTGSAQAPSFPQPTNYDKVKVPTSVKRPWGNLFAPYAIDWNKDGKTDLLVGEGSYSANAVYVLLNQSSGLRCRNSPRNSAFTSATAMAASNSSRRSRTGTATASPTSSSATASARSAFI